MKKKLYEFTEEEAKLVFRWQQLMTLAFHANTGKHEALNAAAKAYAVMRRLGIKSIRHIPEVFRKHVLMNALVDRTTERRIYFRPSEGGYSKQTRLPLRLHGKRLRDLGRPLPWWKKK
jgi:hypothetical protein